MEYDHYYSVLLITVGPVVFFICFDHGIVCPQNVLLFIPSETVQHTYSDVCRTGDRHIQY